MILIETNKITYTNHRDESSEISIKDISSYLTEEVKIGEGVTFKRIFDILLMNRDVFEIIFTSSTGRYPLHYYIDEYVKEDDDNDPNSITYLEIYNATDIWDFDDEISIHNGFHGIRLDYTDEYQKEPFDAPIGVSFTPVNQLKKYPFKINNEIIYQIYNEDKGKYDTLLKGRTPITLFQMYNAILYEISWNGTPVERDERMNDLTATSERIKNGEEKMVEILFDENGKPYTVDEDGNKEPLFNDKKE